MSISQADFAVEIHRLRPALVNTARRMRRCGYQDAEDLISEVVVWATSHLGEYIQEAGVVGMQPWLIGILRRVVQRDHRNVRRRVATEPMVAAENLPGDNSAAAALEFKNVVRTLPSTHRYLVLDWLDGYAQDDIARRNRLHRNTVKVRLEEAFATLRVTFPDPETLSTAIALFAYCSRATVYRKPAASWTPWRLQHPPERPFRRVVTRKTPVCANLERK